LITELEMLLEPDGPRMGGGVVESKAISESGGGVTEYGG
jgi:hypothetical protein